MVVTPRRPVGVDIPFARLGNLFVVTDPLTAVIFGMSLCYNCGLDGG